MSQDRVATLRPSICVCVPASGTKTVMENDNSVPASSLLVDLPAIFSSASAQELLTKPALGALMVEYWCWEQGMADWYVRQPVRRHRDFVGWIVEGRALFDRLDELKQLARGLGP
ncbi:hypothetical protein [Mycobacterium sp.]|uniref:hypothetical protein n=1 Tax=Mycobacterium sp. TaxID=1785 RepID=UPI003C71BFAA